MEMGDKGIDFGDRERTRWRQVSMLERLDTKRTITFNTIECLSGHMNESTPRNNPSSGSLHRMDDISPDWFISGSGARHRSDVA
jgi:hypothetical protein